jgi:hypothetical protein
VPQLMYDPAGCGVRRHLQRASHRERPVPRAGCLSRVTEAICDVDCRARGR